MVMAANKNFCTESPSEIKEEGKELARGVSDWELSPVKFQWDKVVVVVVVTKPQMQPLIGLCQNEEQTLRLCSWVKST